MHALAHVEHRGQITDPAAAREAILAGNAVVTLVSGATGARYTYRIARARDWNQRGSQDPQPRRWFVSLLTGPDNTSDFTYVGMVDDRMVFMRTRASKLPEGAAPMKAIRWALAHLTRGRIGAGLEIWHEGRCCRCGRALTVPESVARGLGPECAGKV